MPDEYDWVEETRKDGDFLPRPDHIAEDEEIESPSVAMHRDLASAISGMASDLTAWNRPPWYRPIRRFRWKRQGTERAIQALRASLQGEHEPIRHLVVQAKEFIEELEDRRPS